MGYTSAAVGIYLSEDATAFFIKYSILWFITAVHQLEHKVRQHKTWGCNVLCSADQSLTLFEITSCILFDAFASQLSVYLLDVLTDINECWNYPGRLCQHTCENTPGSYHCTCSSGFRLSYDEKHCEGTRHFFPTRKKLQSDLRNFREGVRFSINTVNSWCPQICKYSILTLSDESQQVSSLSSFPCHTFSFVNRGEQNKVRTGDCSCQF